MRPFNRPLPPQGSSATQRLHWREEYTRRDRAHHNRWMGQYRDTHAVDIAAQRAAYRAAHREELREKARLYRLKKKGLLP